MTRSPILLSAALLAVAFPAAAGELRGTVRHVGPERPGPERAVGRDRSTCGAAVPDESLLVAGGRLANAVVELRGVPGLPPALVQGALDQVGCRFVPRVQVLPVGSPLAIRSSDTVLHNVHGWAGRATVFDVAMAFPGQPVVQRLTRTGRIEVRCDVHDWMRAWVVVVDGPAAVSAADGSFAIAGLKAGRYTVLAWHERLGERTAEVVVPEEGAAIVEIAF